MRPSDHSDMHTNIHPARLLADSGCFLGLGGAADVARSWAVNCRASHGPACLSLQPSFQQHIQLHGLQQAAAAWLSVVCLYQGQYGLGPCCCSQRPCAAATLSV